MSLKHRQWTYVGPISGQSFDHLKTPSPLIFQASSATLGLNFHHDLLSNKPKPQ